MEVIVPSSLFSKPRTRFIVDPLVRKLTTKIVEQDADEFEDLLDRKVSEAVIHDFLAQRSYFFNGVIRLYGLSPLYSKIRLGSEHEIDFVCFDTGSYGPEWRLVEIEGPCKRLFT